MLSVVKLSVAIKSIMLSVAMLSVAMLSVVMLNVIVMSFAIFFKYNAECRYAECRGTLDRVNFIKFLPFISKAHLPLPKSGSIHRWVS